MIWTDNMLIPKGAAEQVHGRADDELRLRPEDRRPDRGLRLLRLAGQGRRGRDREARPGHRPATRCSSRPTRSSPSSKNFQAPDRGTRRRTSTTRSRPSSAADRVATATAARGGVAATGRLGADSGSLRLMPYLLLAPGLLWLLVFYVVPGDPDVHSLDLDGHARDRLHVDLVDWTTYVDGARPVGRSSSTRSSTAARRRSLRSSIGFPVAYTIAFRGGRYKNLILFLVIAPFFTSFLIRTISWKILLGDDGIVLGPLKDARHSCPPDVPASSRTPVAVVAGHHLQLPAVHDPAALRRAREDRHPAGRGGRGPVRRARGDRAARSAGRSSADWSAWGWGSRSAMTRW